MSAAFPIPVDSQVVTQGNRAIATRPRHMLSAVLGSCVAVCLWDPEARVGGMNHILVARDQRDGDDSDFAGINAMELLVNDLLKAGARRSGFVCKLFGGAEMVKGLSRVGALNADFVRDYCRQERIRCLGESLGGDSARQLRFFPYEGRVMLKRLGSVADLAPEPAPMVRRNGVELF